MKKTIFEGVATALITPFDENGVNYDKLGTLIDWQIEKGINALVVCGTTGEASTMTDDEHREIIDFSVKRAAGRVPIIAGTGSNDTAYALDLIRCAEQSGADAMLVVTPYYNKATQNGLIQMFTQLADASSKPIILYNVPSRTGCNINPDTYAILGEHENIVAIKEAGGNISQIVETMARCGDKLDLYSGNDDQIVPILAMGGKGVISVLSNVAPSETVELCNSFFRGDVKKSAKMQCDFHDLVTALFSEVNPIPVKAAMAAMGFCEDYLRLPLTSMEDAHKKVLLDIMRRDGYLK